MKSKNIEKALKRIIIFEGVALTTFLPPVSKFVGGVNVYASSQIAEIGVVIHKMGAIAVATPFGFSNLWFLALLFVAMGLPLLDILLKDKEGANK